MQLSETVSFFGLQGNLPLHSMSEARLSTLYAHGLFCYVSHRSAMFCPTPDENVADDDAD